MSELRIVKGNDFTTLYKITATYADGTEVEDFDLRSCTDVQVLAHKNTGTGYASIKKDISSFGSYTLEEDNILRIAWDGLLMKNGTYTVDFIAKFRGADIRSYSIRDLVFDIVETNEEANIPAGAFVDNGTYRFSGEFVLMFESQLQADWEQADDTKPDYIKNKPTIPQSLSELSDDSEHRTVTDSEKSEWNNKGTYSKPQDGIPATDLTASVQASLNKANTALQSESDPTVPSWAKASTKPSYTASEVGAFPASTHIPTTLAELTSDSTHRLVTDMEKAAWNDKQDEIDDLSEIRSGASLGVTAYQKPPTGIPASDIASGVIPDVSQFITKSVNDLVNYYLKSETYTKAEVQGLIAAINQFHYEIYPSTSAVTNPQGNVLYLIGPTGTGTDKYEEYVYANNTWVKIGDTSIDLSGYVTTQALNAALANYTTTAELNTLLAAKQDVLTFDNIPTAGSTNPVKSGGVYSSLEQLNAQIETEQDSIQEEIVDIAKPVTFSSIPMLCGQPMILFGNGTPQESIVPINWIQFLDGGYNWTGLPSALGQVYINTAVNSGGRYTAVWNGYVLKWVNS